MGVGHCDAHNSDCKVSRNDWRKGPVSAAQYHGPAYLHAEVLEVLRTATFGYHVRMGYHPRLLVLGVVLPL